MEPRQTISEAVFLSVGASLCYIYILHASNDPEKRPRYVGFTCRPKYREREHHREHKNGRKGEWVEWLMSVGERAILTIVHIFRSDDLAERVLIESTWIESYRQKFPDLLNDTGGGVGVGKNSDVSRKKKSESMKRVCANPAVKMQRSEAMKRRYANPAEREKLNEVNRLRCKSEVDRKRRSEMMKRRWSDPEARKKQSETVKRRLADPITREKYLKAMADPATREKQITAMKQHYANPLLRKKMSETTKQQFADPIARKKHSDAMERHRWEKILDAY